MSYPSCQLLPLPLSPPVARALSPLLLPPPASRRVCLNRWRTLALTSICLLSTCVLGPCPPIEFYLHWFLRVFLGRHLFRTSAETPRRRVSVKRSNLRLRKHFRWIIQLSKCVSKHDINLGYLFLYDLKLFITVSDQGHPLPHFLLIIVGKIIYYFGLTVKYYVLFFLYAIFIFTAFFHKYV